MGADKQATRRARHRKPDAFQEMGGFSYAESHRIIRQFEIESHKGTFSLKDALEGHALIWINRKTGP
ncbi:hypothetical protein [Bradyrhizobium sp.]|jgi:hypothetical protein|uniref:hypothetical protein n=1 Tax=Bradyrhizobium sp. TaxID=376 RepID=UPI003BAEFCAF